MHRKLAMFLLFLSVFAASTVYAQEWRFPGDKITFEQWTNYFNELANTKGAIVTEEPQYYIINLFSDKKRPALYVFTKPNHPAYPAVVIRSMETKDGKSVLLRRGHYAGDKVAFDNWWHAFDALDKKNIDDATPATPPSPRK